MTLLLADGFDFYGPTAPLVELGVYWSGYADNTLSLVVGGPFSYAIGQSLKFSSPTLTGGGNAYFNYANQGEVTVGFALQWLGSDPADVFTVALVDQTGGGAGTTFTFNGSGDITVASDAGAIASWPGVFGLVGWNYFELRVLTGVTGTVTVHITPTYDPPTSYTASGNTQGAGGAYSNRAAFASASVTGGWAIDNLFCYAVDLTPPNDWTGQIAAFQAMAANDVQRQWSPSAGGAVNYIEVDAPQDNYGATFVISITPGAVDLYTVGALPVVPSAVYGVNVRMLLAGNPAIGPGFPTYAIRTVSGATTVDSPTLGGVASPLSTAAWAPVAQYFANDPNTGSTWAASAVAALHIGPKLVSTSG